MAGREEPAVLPIGTEVSAKYKGAFCEAKVKKVVKLVKCKVTVNDSNAHHVVTDDDIRGPIKVGAMVEVKPPGATQSMMATINKVNDHSTYTVVFDDGDENILRRTQLCLKGEKHFVKSETLDDLPLSHPEHFGTPVMKSGKRRRRRNTGSDYDSESGSSGEESDEQAGYQSQELRNMVGRVVCMEVEDRKRTSLLTPALIVQPSADFSTDLSAPDTVLVKSFKDTKFYPLLRTKCKEFTRRIAIDNEDKTLKLAYEKALLYYDTGELPPHWDKEELLGTDVDTSPSDQSSDDEPSEEKDHFVAQLYKFMDERNTPINKGPTIGNRDLNLHKLFKLVRSLGGYNRVTNQMKWPVVHHKMGLPPTINSNNQLKAAYKKYLHAFEDFDRKLGTTLGTMSRPGRSRHGSRRSIMSYRDREDSMPKSPRGLRKKEDDDDAKSAGGESTKSTGRGRSSLGEGEKNLASSRGYDSETESESSRKSRSSEKKTKKDDLDDEKPKKQDPGISKPTTRVGVAKSAEDMPTTKAVGGAKEESGRSIKKDDDRRTRGSPRDVEDSTSEKDDKEEAKKKTKVGKKSVRSDDREEKGKKAGMPPQDESDTNADSDDSEDERREVRTRAREKEEIFSIGTKLKVKYGKGKTQKIYEAKILEVDTEGIPTYLVHYAGWNHRYNEWIRRERIICVVEEGPSLSAIKTSSDTPGKSTPGSVAKTPVIGGVKQTKTTATPVTKSKQPVVLNPVKKRGRPAGSATATKEQLPEKTKEQKTAILAKKAASPAADIAPATGPDVKIPKTTASTEGKGVKVTPTTSDVKTAKSPGTAAAAAATAVDTKPPRPTRSTSVENTLAPGLPSKMRRIRRSSGMQEATDTAEDDSESESSSEAGTDDDDDDEEEEEVRTTRSAAQRAKTDTTAHDLMGALRPVPSSDLAMTSEPPQPPKDLSMHMKDMTQMIRDSNRAREVSSKVKEVAKFREVASKLKEVASKVKEVNTKVKEVESKIKEEVSKEELSAAPKKEAEENEKKITAEQAIEHVQLKDSMISLDVKPKLADLSIAENHDSTKISASNLESEAEKDKKSVKKKEPGKEKKTDGAILSATGSKLAEMSDADSVKVEESDERSTSCDSDADKTESVQSKDSNVKGSKRQQGKPQGKVQMETEKVKSDSEGKDVKDGKQRRGTKAKRQIDVTEEKQTDSETEGSKPKKKRRKKSEKEEEKRDAVVDDKVSAAVTEECDDLVTEERDDGEPVLTPNKGLNVSDLSITSNVSASSAPELLSVANLPAGSAGERSDGDAPMPPQLSPQMPGSSMFGAAVRDRKVGGGPAPIPRVASPNRADVQSPSRPASPALISSNILFDNTPPDTPMSSPVHPPPVGLSPSQEDSSSSTGSSEERRVNMEVESYMAGALPQAGHGSESPGLCDTSTISNGSGGSSGNAPSSEGEEAAPTNTPVTSGAKRKNVDEEGEEDDEDEMPSNRKSPMQKRRKRSHRRNQCDKTSKKSTPKHNMSDSENEADISSKVTVSHSPAHATNPSPRTCKYNFLDLSEAQYLEGEERIQYLMRRIQDLRKIYMQLKAEVACIDRRRKRHKRKEREVAQAAAAAAAQAAVDAVVNQPRVDTSVDHH